jgi:hypothetical protein
MGQFWFSNMALVLVGFISAMEYYIGVKPQESIVDIWLIG